ncbi:hypothetical protein OD917_21210 [Flavobacterium sp. SH_e]|uniref:hypothetical protein n=1 Tax=Flavobacterium TaxID=237 RepID=UPI0021E3FA06|nr:hypothetical protein [Flavobacterium sp. SH_e]MCV2487467.1 hypothetical protein [Flavobacterium sp. SH_e]
MTKIYAKEHILKCFVLILFSTYSSFSNNLKLSDFCKIEIGIKRTDAEKIIGVSCQKVRSSFVYKLDYQCKMKLIYKNDKLIQMYFIDPCAKEYKLDSSNKNFRPFRYQTSESVIEKITINDFCKVKLGMKRNKVLNLIGNQTGNQGSGIVWDEYQFPDKSYFKLWYNNEEKLELLKYVDSCGREYLLESK